MAHPWRGVGGTRSFLLWRLVERNLVKNDAFYEMVLSRRGDPRHAAVVTRLVCAKTFPAMSRAGSGPRASCFPRAEVLRQKSKVSGRDLPQKSFFASFLVISAVEASALSILMSYACWGLRNLQEMGAKLPARGQGGSSRSPRSSSFWYVEREAKLTFV